MSFERYDIVNNNINSKIYLAVKNKKINFKKVVTDSARRLDHYALNQYGDSSYWWVIAAASGIGWWLQVPSGTLLIIPTNLDEVLKLKSL